ncbi:hypothetical protein, partial [uncultured Eudoraea sp.]|uniref:hypothetical protein n=1 Tax=uncultured Eudoraea sp. TaxID=1035614 RepID=UPI002633CDDF
AIGGKSKRGSAEVERSSLHRNTKAIHESEWLFSWENLGEKSMPHKDPLIIKRNTLSPFNLVFWP